MRLRLLAMRMRRAVLEWQDVRPRMRAWRTLVLLVVSLGRMASRQTMSMALWLKRLNKVHFDFLTASHSFSSVHVFTHLCHPSYLPSFHKPNRAQTKSRKLTLTRVIVFFKPGRKPKSRAIRSGLTTKERKREEREKLNEEKQ